MALFIYLAICGLLGFIGMNMADERNRSKAAGFAMGALLGLIGLAVIALMGKDTSATPELEKNNE